MDIKTQDQPRSTEDLHDLKASVAARRELGPEYEDQVLEAFLARIQERVDAQVGQRLPQKAPKAAKPMKGEPVEVAIVAGSLFLAIPLVAIAGGIVGTVGVVFVMLAVVAVNLLYFIDRWVRMN